MSITFNLIIYSCFMSLYCFYVWKILAQKKFRLSNFKVSLCFFLLTTVIIFSYLFVDRKICFVFLYFVFVLINLLLFQHPLNSALVHVLIGQFLAACSELIYVACVIVITALNIDNNLLTFSENNIVNFFVPILSISILKIPFIKNSFLKLTCISEKLNFKQIFISFSFLIITINFLIIFIYFNFHELFLLIINSILIFTYFIITIKALNNKKIL